MMLYVLLLVPTPKLPLKALSPEPSTERQPGPAPPETRARLVGESSNQGVVESIKKADAEPDL